jgi:hypothetical protein
MDLDAFLNPPVLALMIPILAVVLGIVATVAKHRERMAMIEKGMNPDQAKIEKLRIEKERE